jgi:hypothetical protein
MALLDPGDHDRPRDRQVAHRFVDDLRRRLQGRLRRPLRRHVRGQDPDRRSRPDHERTTADDGHTTPD